MKCTCQKDELDETCVRHGRYADIRNLREECDVARATAHAVTDLLVTARAESGRFRDALLRILREANDGEAMAIAAEALGAPLDTTEG